MPSQSGLCAVLDATKASKVRAESHKDLKSSMSLPEQPYATGSSSILIPRLASSLT
jgi:hypothetical protein